MFSNRPHRQSQQLQQALSTLDITSNSSFNPSVGSDLSHDNGDDDDNHNHNLNRNRNRKANNLPFYHPKKQKSRLSTFLDALGTNESLVFDMDDTIPSAAANALDIDLDIIDDDDDDDNDGPRDSTLSDEEGKDGRGDMVGEEYQEDHEDGEDPDEEELYSMKIISENSEINRRTFNTKLKDHLKYNVDMADIFGTPNTPNSLG